MFHYETIRCFVRDRNTFESFKKYDMEILSKQDLELFRIRMISDIEKILVANFSPQEDFGWLRSKAIRKIMDISPATLQNLRITGKIRFKKVMGSYYYNKEDLQKLFEDEN